jgi:hypothetical protein
MVEDIPTWESSTIAVPYTLDASSTACRIM